MSTRNGGAGKTTRVKKEARRTLAALAVDQNTKNIKLMNLLKDLRIKVLDKMSLKDLEQLRCTNREVCEFIDTHAKGLKSVRNLELVRLRDGKCWWYSVGMEGSGDMDYQRRGCREWTEGLQHLYGIHALAIRIESKVTDELLVSLKKSRLTCSSLFIKGKHEPLVVQQLVSILRPSALSFGDRGELNLTNIEMDGIEKLSILKADSVVGTNVVKDSRATNTIVTSTPVTDKELNQLIREWLRYERSIEKMKFEAVEGTEGKPFSNSVLFLGVQKKRHLVRYSREITNPSLTFLVERTDTEALLILMGEGGMVTIFGPSDLTCQHYQEENKDTQLDR